jgi:hypothetical protein
MQELPHALPFLHTLQHDAAYAVPHSGASAAMAHDAISAIAPRKAFIPSPVVCNQTFRMIATTRSIICGSLATGQSPKTLPLR